MYLDLTNLLQAFLFAPDDAEGIKERILDHEKYAKHFRIRSEGLYRLISRPLLNHKIS